MTSLSLPFFPSFFLTTHFSFSLSRISHNFCIFLFQRRFFSQCAYTCLVCLLFTLSISLYLVHHLNLFLFLFPFHSITSISFLLCVSLSPSRCVTFFLSSNTYSKSFNPHSLSVYWVPHYPSLSLSLFHSSHLIFDHGELKRL